MVKTIHKVISITLYNKCPNYKENYTNAKDEQYLYRLSTRYGMYRILNF